MGLRCCLPLLLLVAACQADTTVSLPAAPGLIYTRERIEAQPWEIRAFRVTRDAPKLSLDMALGMGMLKGVEPMQGIVARETTDRDYVVAGVNADFFLMAGNPLNGLVSGLAVRRGELVMTARGRPAFVMLADGTPRIGTFDTALELMTPRGAVPVKGLNEPPVKDSATIYTAIYGRPQTGGVTVLKLRGLPLRMNGRWTGTVSEVVPADQNREAGVGEVVLRGDGTAAAAVAALKVGERVTLRARTPGLTRPVALAVGGNLVLMKNGQILPDPKATDPRHPRTLVGCNGREIVFATVDGRQAGWSVGMRYYELALLMQRLGCRDALNLDGGGSTTAWLRGQDVNRPSDGGERKIANAVLIRSRAPRGPLARVLVTPTCLAVTSRSRVPLDLAATDRWYNPVAADLAGLQASAVRRSGFGLIVTTLEGKTLRVSGAPGEGVVQFRLPGSNAPLAEVPLRLVPGPAQP